MSTLPLLQNILDQPQSLRSVLENANRAALERAASLLRAATGRIIITGMGASFFASLPAHYRLERAGFRTLYIESSELLHTIPSALHEGDVVILVSRSGDSVEVASLLPELKAKGIPSIGITNEPESRLARDTNIPLLLHSAADQMVAIQTYGATVLITSLLAAITSGESLQALCEEARQALPDLTALISGSIDAAPSWRTFLLEAAPLYILGRGLGLTSVVEGMLLFHETAKSAAVAMSCAQFRHGPVEVVTPAFRAILVATAGNTLPLDLRLAADLTAMGAEVRTIGPKTHDAGHGMKALATFPADIPTWLVPLFDVVPLQVAAYELALLRGIVPGSFRYTPQVTTSEVGFASVNKVA